MGVFFPAMFPSIKCDGMTQVMRPRRSRYRRVESKFAEDSLTSNKRNADHSAANLLLGLILAEKLPLWEQRSIEFNWRSARCSQEFVGYLTATHWGRL